METAAVAAQQPQRKAQDQGRGIPIPANVFPDCTLCRKVAEGKVLFLPCMHSYCSHCSHILTDCSQCEAPARKKRALTTPLSEREQEIVLDEYLATPSPSSGADGGGGGSALSGEVRSDAVRENFSPIEREVCMLCDSRRATVMFHSCSDIVTCEECSFKAPNCPHCGKVIARRLHNGVPLLHPMLTDVADINVDIEGPGTIFDCHFQANATADLVSSASASAAGGVAQHQLIFKILVADARMPYGRDILGFHDDFSNIDGCSSTLRRDAVDRGMEVFTLMVIFPHSESGIMYLLTSLHAIVPFTDCGHGNYDVSKESFTPLASQKIARNVLKVAELFDDSQDIIAAAVEVFRMLVQEVLPQGSHSERQALHAVRDQVQTVTLLLQENRGIQRLQKAFYQLLQCVRHYSACEEDRSAQPSYQPAPAVTSGTQIQSPNAGGSVLVLQNISPEATEFGAAAPAASDLRAKLYGGRPVPVSAASRTISSVTGASSDGKPTKPAPNSEPSSSTTHLAVIPPTPESNSDNPLQDVQSSTASSVSSRSVQASPIGHLDELPASSRPQAPSNQLLLMPKSPPDLQVQRAAPMSPMQVSDGSHYARADVAVHSSATDSEVDQANGSRASPDETAETISRVASQIDRTFGHAAYEHRPTDGNSSSRSGGSSRPGTKSNSPLPFNDTNLKASTPVTPVEESARAGQLGPSHPEPPNEKGSSQPTLGTSGNQIAQPVTGRLQLHSAQASATANSQPVDLSKGTEHVVPTHSDIMAAGKKFLATGSEFTRVRRMQVNILGRYGTGKTSFFKTLKGEEFVEQQESTMLFAVEDQCVLDVDQGMRATTRTPADYLAPEIVELAREEHRQAEERKMEAQLPNPLPTGNSPSLGLQREAENSEEHPSAAQQRMHQLQAEELRPSPPSWKSMPNPQLPGVGVVTSTSPHPRSMPVSNTTPRSNPPAGRSTITVEEDPNLWEQTLESLAKDPEQIRAMPDDDVILSVFDYGGHSIFSSIQHMFVGSNYAVYVICMKATDNPAAKEDFQEYRLEPGAKPIRTQETLTNMDHIRHWLTAVYLTRKKYDSDREPDVPGQRRRPPPKGLKKLLRFELPPVVLVATHADKIPENDRQQRREDLWDAIADGCRHLPTFTCMRRSEKGISTKDSKSLFMVDNTKSGSEVSPDVKAVCQRIQAAIDDITPSAQVKKTWVYFEHVLKYLAKKKEELFGGYGFTTRQRISSLAMKACNIGAEEVEQVLWFYHGIRRIFYQPYSDEEGDGVVIFDMAWMVERIGRLLFGEDYFAEKVSPYAKRGRKLLHETGKLTFDLIDTAWGVDPQLTKALFSVMIKADLMYGPEEYDDELSTLYFVPSALKIQADTDVWQQLKKRIERDGKISVTMADVPLIIMTESATFNSDDPTPEAPLPHSAFARLLVKLMKMWQIVINVKDEKIQLGYDSAWLIVPTTVLGKAMSNSIVRVLLAHFEVSGALLVGLELCTPATSRMEMFRDGSYRSNISKMCNFVRKAIMHALGELRFPTMPGIEDFSQFVLPIPPKCKCTMSLARDIGFAKWKVRYTGADSLDGTAKDAGLVTFRTDEACKGGCRKEPPIPDNAYCWFEEGKPFDFNTPTNAEAWQRIHKIELESLPPDQLAVLASHGTREVLSDAQDQRQQQQQAVSDYRESSIDLVMRAVTHAAGVPGAADHFQPPYFLSQAGQPTYQVQGSPSVPRYSTLFPALSTPGSSFSNQSSTQSYPSSSSHAQSVLSTEKIKAISAKLELQTVYKDLIHALPSQDIDFTYFSPQDLKEVEDCCPQHETIARHCLDQCFSRWSNEEGHTLDMLQQMLRDSDHPMLNKAVTEMVVEIIASG